MVRHSLLVAAATLMPGLLAAQVPGGYHLGAPVAVPDRLVEVLARGRFRASVLRSARTPRERDLIAIAERLYPDAETLLRSARDSARRERLVAKASGVVGESHRNAPRAAGNPADRWWLDDFDATWIPYAVTGSAVHYYLNRLRDLAAGRGQFKYGPSEEGDRGTFEYRATVRRGTEPGVAYVVELHISWDYWCGDLCAMSFAHSRSVSFDANGAVLRIAGDEPAVVPVS
jgi:hypothetical protein